RLCGEVVLCARGNGVLISRTVGVRMWGRMSQKRSHPLAPMGYRSRLQGLKGIGWMGLLWPMTMRIGSACFVGWCWHVVCAKHVEMVQGNSSVLRYLLHEGKVRMA